MYLFYPIISTNKKIIWVYFAITMIKEIIVSSMFLILKIVSSTNNLKIPSPPNKTLKK